MNAPLLAPSILEASGVDPGEAAGLLGDALRGADDGEIFLERSQSESFVFDDGRLKSAAFDATEGFGLRVVAGETAGYAHASEISRDAIAGRRPRRPWPGAAMPASPPRARAPPTSGSTAPTTPWLRRASPTRSPCCRTSTPSPAGATRAWPR